MIARVLYQETYFDKSYNVLTYKQSYTNLII